MCIYCMLRKLHLSTCWGLVPQVPQIIGYGPKNLDTVWFPLVANDWGTKYSIPDIVSPLLTEEVGQPT
jgi:hypothetical protein